jgi:hypothetical protein
MSIDAKILDGCGSGQRAEVDGLARLSVSVNMPEPPAPNTPSHTRLLNGLLGTTGLDSGTTNLNLDGSSTQVVAYAEADTTSDFFVNRLTILIADGTVSNNKFGAISALTNGVTIRSTTSGVTTNLITEAKTSGILMTQAGAFDTFGSGTTIYKITSFSTNNDAQLIPMDLGRIMPAPGTPGLRIGRGTLNRLEILIDDDLQALTNFEIRIMGFYHDY